MGASPQRPPVAGTTGSLATDRRHTDAKGQAGDRPARGLAWHPQERSPSSQKPQLTFSYLGLSNFKIRKPAAKWAEQK